MPKEAAEKASRLKFGIRMSSYSVNSSGYGSGYNNYGYTGSHQEMAEYTRNGSGHQGRPII